MDGPALIEHFVLGHQAEVDAAWATLEAVLPFLHSTPAGGWAVDVDRLRDDEIQPLWRGVCLLGWQHPAPDPEP